ncbi:MAG: hypothetical protein AAF587_41150 [Bacteroidota bacterium]
MTLFRTYILGIILLALAFGQISCRKYEDGPNFSLRSKEERVVNTWLAQSVFRNDLDETGQYTSYSMVFERNGRFSWIITPEIGDPIIVGAAWELTSLNLQIKLTFDEKDPISGETRLLYMDIRRLTENELWLSYLFEGDYYDLKLN